MNAIRKFLVGTFVACSSLSLLVTPTSAMSEMEREVQAALAGDFRVAVVETNASSNTEQEENTGSQKAGRIADAGQEDTAPEAVSLQPAAAVQVQEVPAAAGLDCEDEIEMVTVENETENKEEESAPEAENETVEEEPAAVSLLGAADAQPVPSYKEKIALADVEEEEEAASAVNPYLIEVELMPDFGNLEIWQNEQSPYHKARLWGQCTWFSWHRFYEIYGFNPGFRGNGYEVAAQLAASHPEEFELSSTPKAGSIFSYMNHTGVVLAVNEDGTLLIQDGNYNGVTDYDWNVAISDWNTFTVSLDEFVASNPGVIFANPINYVVTVK